MPRNRDEDGCLTTEEMQISAYRAFTKFEFRLGRSQPEWVELEDDVRSAWSDMVNKILVQFDDEEAELSVIAMADEAHQRFAEGITGELPADFLPWDDLDEVLREEWKWLVRHIANMLAYDKDENEGLKIPDHEDKIDDFFRAKLEELGFSLACPLPPKEPDHGRETESLSGAAPGSAAGDPVPEQRGPRDDDEGTGAVGSDAAPDDQPPPTLTYGHVFVGGFGS